MTSWYEESFGHDYLELYAHRDAAEARADIQAVVSLLSPPKDEPLLDLCCGACRHLAVLREMGFGQLVGLDLSRDLLRVGGEEPSREGLECPAAGLSLVRADMRAVPFRETFATVLSLFTSFGYFQGDEDNQMVLRTVHRALRAGGSLLIDYMNRDHVIANLVERDENWLPDRRVQNVRCLTDGCRRVEKTTAVVTSTGVSREFHESVRLYSEREMADMLKDEGFVKIRSYGSLRGDAFRPGSKRLVLVAEKGA